MRAARCARPSNASRDLHSRLALGSPPGMCHRLFLGEGVDARTPHTFDAEHFYSTAIRGRVLGPGPCPKRAARHMQSTHAWAVGPRPHEGHKRIMRLAGSGCRGWPDGLARWWCTEWVPWTVRPSTAAPAMCIVLVGLPIRPELCESWESAGRPGRCCPALRRPHAPAFALSLLGIHEHPPASNLYRSGGGACQAPAPRHLEPCRPPLPS